MKKTLLILSALLISTGAFAQANFGVKAGLNLATMTNFDDAKMKPSLYAGAFVEMPFTNIVGLQVEALYSGQGFKTSMEGVDIFWRNSYINVPVLAKFYVAKNFSIEVGPQVGFMLGDPKIKVDGGGISKTFDYDEIGDLLSDISGETIEMPDLNKLDVSAAIGATYSIMGMIDVSARCNIGLTNYFKDIDSGDNSKNLVVQIGVGYKF